MIEEQIVLFWPSLIGVALIVLAHLFAPHFQFMRKSNNIWVPASVGVALAYVFMDIFPHLAKSKAKLVPTVDNPVYEFLTHNIYLVGLAGFTVYLGIILSDMMFRKNPAAGEITFRSAPTAIKIEFISLSAYNFLVGYLLSEHVTHRPEPALLFGLAMAAHFAGLNHLTRNHFPGLYDGLLRYAFTAAVLAGWIAGVALEISNMTLELWYSFLAGGIIVVAAVYELPHIRSYRQYLAFVVGAGLFSVLILSMNYYGK
jgi:hypothetical protein